MDGDVEMVDVDGENQKGSVCVTFNLKSERDQSKFPLGEFKVALTVFESAGASIKHVETRQPGPDTNTGFGFYIECLTLPGMEDIVKKLETSSCTDVKVTSVQTKESVPWFPKNISELDRNANKVLEAGGELKSDHPGFNDQEYRQRRKYFADVAMNYKHGDPIPRVQYTEEETHTWSTIYNKLVELYPTHACKEHNDVFPDLQRECGYREDNIPQLADISKFLKKRSGFTLRPVAGLLSSRDFLAGLAFRVFHSTQYIRHGSKPLYTPEPDVCHELLGHVPLLSDPTFAQFSQEIGLASLGAPDEYVKQLATLYWFTIEFGLCKQGDQVKAYGAGLLSSFGELKYSLTNEPEVRPLDPPTTSVTEYPITKYQPVYFVANSFTDAKDKLMDFARSIPRPFALGYDAFTDSVVVMNDTSSVIRAVQQLRAELDLLQDAIGKLK